MMPNKVPAISLNDFLTVGEAAGKLGVTAGTLRNWDRGGKLKPVRHPVNGYRLYRQSDLEVLLMRLSDVQAPLHGSEAG